MERIEHRNLGLSTHWDSQRAMLMGNNGPWVAMMMIVATKERIQGNVQLPVGDHRWKNCVPRIASQVFPIIFINIRKVFPIIDMNIRKVFPIYRHRL